MNEPFELYSTKIDADPYPYYNELRNRYPCYWSKSANIWFLSRFEDVAAAGLDWQTYSSLSGNMVDEIPGRSGGTLGTTDPPRHDRLRGLVQFAFAKKNLAEAEITSVRSAERALSGLKGRSHFDFVSEFSSTITVETLFDLLGLPASDPVKIRKNVVLSISTDKANRGRNQELNEAFFQLTGFISELVEQRRMSPADDLITRLAESEIDGDRLSQREIVLTATMFVVAGIESLSSFMSMFALNLATHSEARKRLVESRDLIPQAIEESLRYNTSAQRFKRVLTRDVTLHGQEMKAGDSIVLMYGAANRDERKFPDPDVYNIDRNPRGHLGFGIGKHFCIGSTLARMVAARTMECFLQQFPDLSLAADKIDWVPSSNFRTPVSLPLRVR